MEQLPPPLLPKTTAGQKVADFIARNVGSWKFIITQSAILLAWLVWNTAHIVKTYHFDPYPYILLNLMLSFQAAYTGPILLIAANRQAKRDRVLAETTNKMVKALLELTNHLIEQGEREADYNAKLHVLLQKIREHQDYEFSRKANKRPPEEL